MIERKLMAHFINTNFGGEDEASYFRIGKDLTEFSVNLNPQTEQSEDILGNSTFKHSGYQAQSDVGTYYATVGDPLFETLQEIADTRATGDQCKTDVVEVHLWESKGDKTYVAWQQPAYCIPTQYGGDTSGYQIPFQINYVEDRVKGTFNTSTRTFTPEG